MTLHIVRPLGRNVDRGEAKCLRDGSGQHEWRTPLGDLYALRDGTVLIRPDGDAVRTVPSGKYAGERFAELSVQEARELAWAILRVAGIADRRQQVLDGRAAWVCWNDGARWWVRHHGQTMALRLSRLRTQKPPRVQTAPCRIYGATTSVRPRRPCAACGSGLTTEAYVCDRSVTAHPPRYGAYPNWWRGELCRECVETTRQADVGANVGG